MAKKKLSFQQMEFVEEYLETFNVYESYMKAFKSTAMKQTIKSNASRELKKQEIQEAIEKRQEELRKKHEKTKDRIVEELSRIAFAKPTNVVNVIEKEELDEDSGEVRTYKTIEVKNTKELAKEIQSTISEIKQGKNGIEIKFNDKMKAIELLMKYFGMLEDKTKIEGSIGIDTSKIDDLTLDEIMKIAGEGDWNDK